MILAERQYLISAFGFSGLERRVLKSIFKLVIARDITYSLVDPGERITADIALVDADDSDALEAWRRQCESQTGLMPAVMVMKAVPSNEEQVSSSRALTISRPLTMKKVLGALEQVTKSQSEEQRDAPSDASSNKTGAPVVSRFSALVVDDSLPVRTFMESKLGALNVAVDIDFAASGEQAIALTRERRYDIIFLDVILPGIDGYRVCKSIKAESNSRSTPVIMLTSKKSPFDRVKGSMAGCDAYLTKPPDEKRLDAIISKYLLERRGSSLPGHVQIA